MQKADASKRTPSDGKGRCSGVIEASARRKEGKKMANWKDVRQEDNPLFDGAEYMEVKKLVGQPIEVMDVKVFDNDKGPGVAVLCNGQKADDFYFCTHSIGLVNVLGSDEFVEALKKEFLWVVIREGTSKKTGRQFLYVE